MTLRTVIIDLHDELRGHAMPLSEHSFFSFNASLMSTKSSKLSKQKLHDGLSMLISNIDVLEDEFYQQLDGYRVADSVKAEQAIMNAYQRERNLSRMMWPLVCVVGVGILTTVFSRK